ncbi:MAG: thioredoxin [Coriobacteriia bacterium]|nr:thioredoxin [Coriobacteriia bacterium]
MTQMVTSADFQEKVLDNPLPVLVDFSASWCGPCRRVAPIVDEIAQEHEGSVAVFKLDIDESRDIAERYRVMSVPTLMVFQDGQVVNTAIGARPKSAIEALLP